jgi:type II secretory pathway component GspD/PulD (secretin)
MNTKTFALLVLASLIALPFLNGQERPTRSQLRSAQDAAAAQRAAAVSEATPAPQQREFKPFAQVAGPLVTLEVLLIDYKGRGNEKEATAPTAAEFIKLHQIGELDRVVRAQLTNIEQNKTMVQVGQRVPVATARTVGGFARGGAAAPDARPTAYSYSLENIGTLISATTRLEESGTVIVDLQVERSQIAAADRRQDDNLDGAGPQKTVSLVSQSTLRLKPGEPTLAKAFQTTSNGETTGQFIVVTAMVDARGAERAEARPGDDRQIRAFALQNAEAKSVQRVLADVFGDRPMRIALDEASNRVIVAGAPEQLEEVERLLQALDQPQGK